MSVSIATMGKFVNREIKEVEVDGGGSSYGWERKKPKIIVSDVYDKEDYIKIRITKVTEWN